ncbi:MAG TPA: MoxR family ATPase [Gemmataceae bacterium]|nr:MoxR family ATPase [Gemmataceae bacterium]
MKPTRVLQVLDRLFATRWPVFLWGPPGAGKSSVVRLAAHQRDLPLIDIRASLLDPTDLRGIPAVQDGRAVWCPPSFLPQDDTPPGILFFDELNAAPALVQASLYQLTLDRRVGEYRLPDGWRILAAGNRAEDHSVTFRMPAALANRFIHLDFEVDFEDWRAWAGTAGIHPLVVGFLGTRRELLLRLQHSERGFPTPRAWEMVSDALGALGRPTDAADVILGIVGEGAATEFLGYCDRAISEEALLAILADPTNAALPRTLGDQYALIAYITANARQREVIDAAGVLIGRLSPELAVLLIRDLLRVDPMFVRHRAYKDFIARHAQLL